MSLTTTTVKRPGPRVRRSMTVRHQARVQHRLLVGGSAGRRARGGQGGGAARLRLGVDRRGLRLRRAHAARLVGRAHERIQLGTAIVQMLGAHAGGDGDGGDDARPPVRRPLDPRPRRVRPAGRRGLVRPAVPAPLARTREYVDIVRRDRRPRRAGRASTASSTTCRYRAGAGLGKPLKSTVHPLRAEIPIYLGAEGPKNVALAAEIADGWLPLFFAPKEDGFYRECLAKGFAASRRAGQGGPVRGHVRRVRSCPATTPSSAPTSCARVLDHRQRDGRGRLVLACRRGTAPGPWWRRPRSPCGRTPRSGSWRRGRPCRRRTGRGTGARSRRSARRRRRGRSNTLDATSKRSALPASPLAAKPSARHSR